MRRITPLMCLLALGAGNASARAPDPDGLPAWLAGCWIQQEGQAWTEECWTAPRAGMMLGSGRSGVGERLRSWEATQILPDAAGKPVFWASPQGGQRVAFPLASRTASEMVFANPAHDYPQRIRYWRDGATLNAEISMLDGSKPMRWHFSAMR